ncbi:MAG: inositol monophosphatase family protein [Burkholderiales bacterium]|nr:inositol monophosphatase family protein [Burkholderiales bacterium]MCE7878424.1 histidinol-phosphatase [Betaproteobacteria bacterium PRO3]
MSPDDYLEFAYRTVVDAGAATLPHFRVPIAVDDKGDTGYDPVTAADRDAEAVIRAAIAKAFPDHGIRGEEHGFERGRSRHTWVIDPVDGTRSFITGQLHWGMLVALHDGERVVCGVSHQPYVGETFLASAGGKARFRHAGTERALSTRRCGALGDAILASTSPDLFDTPARAAGFARVRSRVRLTRFGGDCYAYCLLAMGLIDVVVESGLHAWDIQALIPIIEGAGGVVTAWDGGVCEEGGDVVACGDPSLAPQVRALLRGA